MEDAGGVARARGLISLQEGSFRLYPLIDSWLIITIHPWTIGTIPPPPGVDYYAVLSVAHDASTDEITQAWRRLVLLHHPDRQISVNRIPPTSSSTDTSNAQPAQADIRLINEARWVLSDPQRRKEWQAAYASGKVVDYPEYEAQGPRLRETVSLSAFTPHYGLTHSEHAVDDDEAQPEWFSYRCRCASDFVITLQDLENDVDVVGCGGCGEWIGVAYKVVDAED